MKRVTGCGYETSRNIPDLLTVDGVDIDNRNKRYTYERVIHAHWICMSDCGVTKCSHCGWNIEEYVEYKRCQECGAHMDEIPENR